MPTITDVGTDGLVCRGFSYPDTNIDRFHQFCQFSCLSNFVYQYFQRDNLGVGPTPRTTEIPLAQSAFIPFVYHYLKILATLDVKGVN